MKWHRSWLAAPQDRFCHSYKLIIHESYRFFLEVNLQVADNAYWPIRLKRRIGGQSCWCMLVFSHWFRCIENLGGGRLRNVENHVLSVKGFEWGCISVSLRFRGASYRGDFVPTTAGARTTPNSHGLHSALVARVVDVLGYVFMVLGVGLEIWGEAVGMWNSVEVKAFGEWGFVCDGFVRRKEGLFVRGRFVRLAVLTTRTPSHSAWGGAELLIVLL